MEGRRPVGRHGGSGSEAAALRARIPGRRPWDPDHELFRLCLTLAGREPDPACRVEHLLGYLETFPLGQHNRRVAETIEILLDVLPDTGVRSHLNGRLRILRDSLMEPTRPGTWICPRPSMLPV